MLLTGEIISLKPQVELSELEAAEKCIEELVEENQRLSAKVERLEHALGNLYRIT
jgi:regulator of replication initiation timing